MPTPTFFRLKKVLIIYIYIFLKILFWRLLHMKHISSLIESQQLWCHFPSTQIIFFFILTLNLKVIVPWARLMLKCIDLLPCNWFKTVIKQEWSNRASLKLAERIFSPLQRILNCLCPWKVQQKWSLAGTWLKKHFEGCSKNDEFSNRQFFEMLDFFFTLFCPSFWIWISLINPFLSSTFLFFILACVLMLDTDSL